LTSPIDPITLAVLLAERLDALGIVHTIEVQLADGRSLYVHPPEDILLQKLRWYVKGGETSDRQWRDILAIVRVQGPGLDRGYVDANAGALGVRHVLVRALEESKETP
jgi:hypothetical protein